MGMSTGSWLSKHGKGNYDDIETERKYRLRKIKQLHKPIDYEKLSIHSKLFSKISQNRLKRKKKELKEQCKELESAYKEKMKDQKSKNYMDSEKTYYQERNSFDVKKKEDHKKREMSVDAANKFVKLYFPPINNASEKHRSKFPKEGKKHYEWLYGRFGTREWNSHIKEKKEMESNKIYNEKGNEYLKGSAVLNLTDKQKEQIILKRKEEELKALQEEREQSKKKDAPNYLKDFNYKKPDLVKRSNGRNLSFDLDNMRSNFYSCLNVSNHEAILEDSINFFTRKKRTSIVRNTPGLDNLVSLQPSENIFVEKKKKLLKLKIGKFDEQIKSKENGTNETTLDFPKHIFSVKTNEDLLDKSYVQSIRAKLAFLTTSNPNVM